MARIERGCRDSIELSFWGNPGTAPTAYESLWYLPERRKMKRVGLIALVSALASFSVSWSQNSQQISVRLTISLTGIGYKAETGCGHKGEDVPSNLTSLNDDDKV